MDIYCGSCQRDVKPTGLNACPTCDEDLSQGMSCLCGKEVDGLSECKLCGAYICKDCLTSLGQFDGSKHFDVEICKECDEEMMHD